MKNHVSSDLAFIWFIRGSLDATTHTYVTLCFTVTEGFFSILLWIVFFFLGSLQGAIFWQYVGNGFDSWQLCFFDENLLSVRLFIFPVHTFQ
jgi:hypothetical protein